MEYALTVSTAAPSGNALGMAFGSVAHLYTHLFTLLFATASLAIQRDWQVDYSVLAAANVPMFVLFGGGALPAGWLGDRWSAPGMIAIFFIGIGGAAIFTGFAPNLLWLTVGLALIGLFASIYHPVGIAWLVRNARNRGRALGINGIFGSLGTAGAALAAGYLAERYGWRAAFWVPGAVSLATGLVFVTLLLAGRVADAEHDVSPDPAPSRQDARRTFWVLFVTMLMTGLVYQATAIGLPKIFEERAGGLIQGSFGVGILVSIVYTVSAFTQYIGGELVDRYAPRTVYLVVQVLQIPAIVGAIYVGGPALVAMAMVMVSFAVVGQPAENTLLARYTPAKWRGRAFGAKFVVTLGVSSLGVALVPAIHYLTGSLDGLLVALALFCTIAALACLALPVDRKPRAAVRPAPAE